MPQSSSKVKVSVREFEDVVILDSKVVRMLRQRSRPNSRDEIYDSRSASSNSTRSGPKKLSRNMTLAIISLDQSSTSQEDLQIVDSPSQTQSKS